MRVPITLTIIIILKPNLTSRVCESASSDVAQPNPTLALFLNLSLTVGTGGFRRFKTSRARKAPEEDATAVNDGEDPIPDGAEVW